MAGWELARFFKNHSAVFSDDLEEHLGAPHSNFSDTAGGQKYQFLSAALANKSLGFTAVWGFISAPGFEIAFQLFEKKLLKITRLRFINFSKVYRLLARLGIAATRCLKRDDRRLVELVSKRGFIECQLKKSLEPSHYNTDAQKSVADSCQSNVKFILVFIHM